MRGRWKDIQWPKMDMWLTWSAKILTTSLSMQLFAVRGDLEPKRRILSQNCDSTMFGLSSVMPLKTQSNLAFVHAKQGDSGFLISTVRWHYNMVRYNKNYLSLLFQLPFKITYIFTWNQIQSKLIKINGASFVPINININFTLWIITSCLLNGYNEHRSTFLCIKLHVSNLVLKCCHQLRNRIWL